MARVGVLGAGRMGLPIICQLASQGFSVAVFDPDSKALDAAKSCGATVSENAGEMATQVEVLITVLPGPAELEEAMVGENGVLAYLRPGACWLDFTSNDPRIASQIAAIATDQGVQSVGAPMAGGPAEASAGTLGFYVGGESPAVDRVLPILRALGAPYRLALMGPDIASGYTTKLLANMLWFGQAIAATETLLLGQELGLDLPALHSALKAGPGNSEFVMNHLDALLAGNYLTTFGLDRVVEELDTVTSLAAAAGTPSDLMAVVAALHREALDRFGPVDGELLAAKLLEAKAGRTLRVIPRPVADI